MSVATPPPPGYLLEANYYRLAYQLAAQRVNGAREGGTAAGVHRHDRRRAPERQAYEDVRRFGAEIQRALDHLDALTRASQVPWHRRLDAKEVRLRRFLMSTVRPSVELIIAGMEARRGDLGGAEGRVRTLFARQGGVAVDWRGWSRHAVVTVVPWSFRAYYNLACYAADRDDACGDTWHAPTSVLLAATGRSAEARDARAVVGIWGLRQSFRLAAGRRRQELVRWAGEDPTLAPLRDGRSTGAEVRELLERYAGYRAKAAPAYAVEGWTPADGNGRPPSPEEDAAVGEAVRGRAGYQTIRPATVHAPGRARVRLDALLQALPPARTDVLIDVRRLPGAAVADADGLAAAALDRRSSYQAVTARTALVWLIVIVPAGADPEPLEERLTTALAGAGAATVVDERQLPALRRMPLPA